MAARLIGTRPRVLAGISLAHALQLHAWAQQPAAVGQRMLIARQPLLPLRCLWPAWLSGQIRDDDLSLDLRPLCHAAQVHMETADVAGVDERTRVLHLDDGRQVDFDTVSLADPASTPAVDASIIVLDCMEPIRTAPTFRDLLHRWITSPDDAAITVVAVGDDLVAVESLLAATHLLRRLRPDRRVHAGLVSRNAILLGDAAAPWRRLAARALTEAKVAVQLGGGWCQAIARGVDVLLWARGPRDPADAAMAHHGRALLDLGDGRALCGWGPWQLRSPWLAHWRRRRLLELFARLRSTPRARRVSSLLDLPLTDRTTAKRKPT